MKNTLYKFKFDNNKERFFNIYMNEPKNFESYQDFKDSFNNFLIVNNDNSNLLLKLGEKAIEINKNNNKKKLYMFFKFLYQSQVIWVNKNFVEKL